MYMFISGMKTTLDIHDKLILTEGIFSFEIQLNKTLLNHMITRSKFHKQLRKAEHKLILNTILNFSTQI